MRRYNTATPRTPLAVAAVAMAAVTMSLMVVVPAQMDSSRLDARTLTEREASAVLASAAAVDPPTCTEVDATQAPKSKSVQVGTGQPKHKHHD